MLVEQEASEVRRVKVSEQLCDQTLDLTLLVLKVRVRKAPTPQMLVRIK